MTAYKLIESQTATGLAHWACYFINGDGSGMSEEDIAEADAWLAFQQPEESTRHARVVDVSDDDSDRIGFFYGVPRGPFYNDPASLATYTLLVYEKES